MYTIFKLHLFLVSWREEMVVEALCDLCYILSGCHFIIRRYDGLRTAHFRFVMARLTAYRHSNAAVMRPHCVFETRYVIFLS